MTSSGRWLWKTPLMESQYRFYNLSYEFTLATSKPLSLHHLEEALTHLFRKVPSLRACYVERDGDLWTKEMDEERIDFAVMPSTSETDAIHKSLIGHRFNAVTGPLWCVRLRPEPSCPEAGEVSGAILGYPHVSTIFLGIHHGITDGTSNMQICGWLARLLDQVIAATPIDDLQQLGTFVSAEKTQKLVEAHMDAISNNPELRRNILEDAKLRRDTPALLNVAFKKMDGEETTRSILKELDTATTAAFIKKCKAEGVTVNSAFSAVVSVAHVDVLVEAGMERDIYPLGCIHFLNARRYWDGHNTSLGCHILGLSVIVDTPRDINGHFWDFARSLHKEFQQKINAKDAIKEEAAKHFIPIELSNEGKPKLSNVNFGVSNMGDVTGMVACDGDHLRVMRVLRTIQMPFNWTHLVHTFQGRLIHVLPYNTAYVSIALAERYIERIYHHLFNALI